MKLWTIQATYRDYTAAHIVEDGYIIADVAAEDACAVTVAELDRAKLIVAAPDLLAALQFIVNAVDIGEDAWLTLKGYEAARAAIAKAGGAG